MYNIQNFHIQKWRFIASFRGEIKSCTTAVPVQMDLPGSFLLTHYSVKEFHQRTPLEINLIWNNKDVLINVVNSCNDRWVAQMGG